jgi:hypothetical protein
MEEQNFKRKCSAAAAVAAHPAATAGTLSSGMRFVQPAVFDAYNYLVFHVVAVARSQAPDGETIW